ncbi:beta 1-4 rhamnosyltransferase Cps2T [Enterococcus saccharolyticus]|uniref:beta 1-4 rhamnosyltransferase Cps2T n=1 Tax=Enterococcus saccharolyticus TaxID=41997 RepID=UPI0039DFE880
MNKKNVYIIGSKGIPAKYGGFETFVEKITEYQKSDNIQYHVACMKENSAKSNIIAKHFDYNGADCFNISVPSIGPAKAIYYDIIALNYALNLAKTNNDANPIFYVLACRIGPFIGYFKKQIAKINGTLFVNPDGHEWLREKWSKPVRTYWKFSEKIMVKHSDLLICDSLNIEKYILTDYKIYQPKTKYIAYGTDLQSTKLTKTSNEVTEWYSSKKVTEKNYYLIVGRFVPENNLELIIKEFMASNTQKDLVIISNVEQNDFYNKLLNKTMFDNDNRIKFVGTVYNQELLKYIRENAYAYIHGHEVGGTNPSLLEAMACTHINLLLDVGFNREVGRNSTLYFPKEENGLKEIINSIETKNYDYLKPRKEIEERYTWEKISDTYEKIFTI